MNAFQKYNTLIVLEFQKYGATKASTYIVDQVVGGQDEDIMYLFKPKTAFPLKRHAVFILSMEKFQN